MHTFLLGMVCDESAYDAENSDIWTTLSSHWHLNSMCVPYDIG